MPISVPSQALCSTLWVEGARIYRLYTALWTLCVAHAILVSLLVDIYTIEYRWRYTLCACRQTWHFTLNWTNQHSWAVLLWSHGVNKSWVATHQSRGSPGNIARLGVLSHFHISSASMPNERHAEVACSPQMPAGLERDVNHSESVPSV